MIEAISLISVLAGLKGELFWMAIGMGIATAIVQTIYFVKKNRAFEYKIKSLYKKLYGDVVSGQKGEITIIDEKVKSFDSLFDQNGKKIAFISSDIEKIGEELKNIASESKEAIKDINHEIRVIRDSLSDGIHRLKECEDHINIIKIVQNTMERLEDQIKTLVQGHQRIIETVGQINGVLGKNDRASL